MTTNRPTPIKLEGFAPAGSAPVRYSLGTPAPANGRVDGNGNQQVVYTPRPGFLGTDRFGYTVTGQDGRKVSAVVNITVKRPNIVVVMADDQNAEQQRFLSRTNELIGKAGTTFSDMVVSYSECCPSRSTFLTGQYAHNHGVVSSAYPTGGVTKLRDGDTLATRLRNVGYRTSLAGKYLNGYGNTSLSPAVPPTYVPPGWTDWFGFVEPDSYNFFNYAVSDNGRVVRRGSAPEDYSTDVVFARSEQIIRDHGGGATPLFVYVAPTAPHSTWNSVAPIPAPRHRGRYANERVPRTPAHALADVSAMPPWIRSLSPVSDQTRANIDNVYRLAAESLRAVDEGVERLVNALAEKGELDNTVFVYTSDNGYHYGDHRTTLGKSDQYEESLRVPLLIRGPGFPAGRVVRQPVANVDLYPTLVAAAGVAPGRVPDGVALYPIIQDPSFGVHRAIVIENGPYLNRRTWVGIRDDRYTYVESSTGDKELYDRLKDPYETRNIYGDPAAALGQYLAAYRLAHLRQCAGTACHVGLVRQSGP